MTLEDAIRELFFWQYNWLHGHPRDNFHAILYGLIHKADQQNKARLRLAFPEEVQAWEMWVAAPKEEAFFAEHGWKLSPNIQMAQETRKAHRT